MNDESQMHLLSLTSIQNLDTRVDKPFLYIIFCLLKYHELLQVSFLWYIFFLLV